jgi:acetyl esterase/lipase
MAMVGVVLFGAWLANANAQDAKPKILRDITYGKGGDEDMKLDLALPAENDDARGSSGRPCIVCIHGGGWRGGKRQDLNMLIDLLAKKGFVAATVSYRLSPKHQFPAQIEDCKAAVRWLRANAKEHRINPDKFGAVGFSAGGHLVSLMGASDKEAGLEGEGGNLKESSRVQAVVNFFGPTDFTEKTWNEKVEETFFIPFMGGTFEDKKSVYKKCSPIVYCSKDDPPFLFFHGDKDTLVPILHSERMWKKLKEVGVAAELVTMKGEAHGWGGEKLTKTLNQTIEFFGEKLKR